MFGARYWPKTDKTARVTSISSVMLFLLNVVFVFSIGIWGTKVARTGKSARAASFNRIMFFLLHVVLCSLLVLRTQKWREQAKLRERLASVESCCLC